ncbi:MAG: hypothetical protein QNL62_18510 [Gammaproteobacteria bacterium]|nr:hypothetical protein [Gammaproteobacteria bacterium]
MNAKFLLLMALFFTSWAQAHPNHMSFEDVRHNGHQVQSTTTKSDNSRMGNREEKYAHNDSVPCVEQHKKVPCKRK